MPLDVPTAIINLTPNEHSWLCSAHFIGGVKSNDSTCQDYVPSVFHFIETPKKKRAERSLLRYYNTKRKHVEAQRRQEEENERLRMTIEVERLTEEGFKNISPLKIKYFTGRPFFQPF